MVKKNPISDFDPGTVLKDIHDPEGRNIRVRDANSLVPADYTRAVFTKNLSGSITEAIFYRGTQAQKTRIKFVGDVGGSLNNTYFLINSAENQVEHYVWYNVGGAGTDPNLVGKVGIEIAISTNDPASIVCLATKLLLESCEHFFTDVNGSDVLLVTNEKNGATISTVDVSTGFGITTIHVGVTERICGFELPEDPDVKYIFNEAERSFELATTVQVTGPLEVYTTSPIDVNVMGFTVSAGTVANISAPLANTEYSFTLAPGVGSFEMSARGIAKVQWSFTAGTTGTIFKTIYPGGNYEKSGIVSAIPITIYFRTTKPGEVLEVVTYA